MTDWQAQALTAVGQTNEQSDQLVSLAAQAPDYEGFAYVRMASDAARQVAVALLEKTDPLAVPVIRQLLEWTDESSATLRHLRDIHQHVPNNSVRPRDLEPLHDSLHADEGTATHKFT